MPESISFETADGLIIKGDYYPSQGSNQAVLLLHMRPETKSSWKSLAEQLVANGFSVLAIDLRGHGESVLRSNGGAVRYETFTEPEEQQSIKDLEAAGRWLEEQRGFLPNNLALVGASIGANLALQYLSERADLPAAVLLSPGLVYRGIDTQPMLEKLASGQRLMFVAAKDDTYSALTVGVLNEKTAVSHQTKIFDSGGHGTHLFSSHPSLKEEIIVWLKK
ncbi:alpha/beta fold hydrolase [Candidatus Uhrbacteria bacterium]|nr:alpha/beta fold hydrolase [Candidatus Uhrbacteria bacterium]